MYNTLPANESYRNTNDFDSWNDKTAILPMPRERLISYLYVPRQAMWFVEPRVCHVNKRD
jgi:hypothetical protein